MKVARAEKPDIALVDLTIGPLDGLKLIEKFSHEPSFKGMKTALLYGHFKKINDELLSQVGADGKLAKPFDSQEFLEVLEALTNKETKIVVTEPVPVEPKPAAPARIEASPMPNLNTDQVVEMPKDEFKSLFDDEELEACLNFLEKPLTPSIIKKELKKEPEKEILAPQPMISATDDSAEVKPVDQASRAMIEKVCWEVIPPLAERIIREEIQKLLKES